MKSGTFREDRNFRPVSTRATWVDINFWLVVLENFSPPSRVGTHSEDHELAEWNTAHQLNNKLCFLYFLTCNY